MKIIDISVPIGSSMPVWPGDPAVVLHRLSAIEHDEQANVTEIKMSVHTGTHIDAPSHFIDNAASVDQIPMKKLVGKVLVLKIDETVDVVSDQVLVAHPKKDLLENAEKVLFHTKNSSLWLTHPEEFQTNYVGIDESGAAYLSELSLDLIGLDYLSIAPYDETIKPHRTLLSKGIVLLEGINLTGVTEGYYDLFCLPLNIADCEGAPARVILIDHER